jgi:hypothetical protein
MFDVAVGVVSPRHVDVEYGQTFALPRLTSKAASQLIETYNEVIHFPILPGADVATVDSPVRSAGLCRVSLLAERVMVGWASHAGLEPACERQDDINRFSNVMKHVTAIMVRCLKLWSIF